MKRILAIALLLLLVAGCGSSGPSAADKKAAAAKAAKASASASAAAKAEADEKAAEAQQAKYEACVAEIQPLADALDQINSRLSVGLNYSEYGDKLGDVSVAYDKIHVDQLAGIAPKCLNAAAKLEGSYNKFSGVLTRWGKCLDDYNCDFSKGETNRKTQADWAKAGVLLDNGKTLLESIAPAVAPTATPSP